MDAEGGEGFQIGLDSGAAAAVRAGDCESDWQLLHRKSEAQFAPDFPKNRIADKSYISYNRYYG